MSNQIISGIEYSKKDIVTTEAHVLIPVSAETTLRQGIYDRLVQVRGEEYENFRTIYNELYENRDERMPLVQSMTPIFSIKDLPIIIFPVRVDRYSAAVNMDERAIMLIAALQQRGVRSVAISRKAMRGQRLTGDQFDDLCLMLVEAQIHTVVYE